MSGPVDGADTVVVPQPSHVIQASGNRPLMHFQSTNTERSMVVHVPDPSPDIHDINAGDIVLGTDVKRMQALEIGYQPNSMARDSYGKIFVIAQTAGLPHGLKQTDYVKAISKTPLVQVLMRESVMSYLFPVGISLANYNYANGPSHTPQQMGIAVQVHGPNTIRVALAAPIRAFTPCAIAILPPEGEGRQRTARYISEGPDRRVPTLRPLDERATPHIIRGNVGMFVDRHINNSAAAATKAVAISKSNAVYGAVTNPKGTDGPVLESDKCGGQVSLAIAGILMAGIEALVESGVLTYTGNNFDKRDSRLADKWRAEAATVLGASLKKAVDPNTKQAEAIADILQKVSGNRPVEKGDASYRTLISSSLSLFAAAVQDVAATHDRPFCTVLSEVPSQVATAGSANTTLDVFVNM